jgi:UDP-N-acetylglucosamine 1-carboxyvinyltransferase
MDKIIVHGGADLSGSVRISGSKNSSLPILAATLLTREECTISHVPDLSDTNYMLQILTKLGVEFERHSGVVSVRAEKVKTVANYDLVRKMRASICLLGPLMGRMKEATISLPGGCVIGDRPIDLHLRGMEGLGATVRTERGYVKLLASRLVGGEIVMGGKFGSTVLGTGNVMMAATLAEGRTIIEGAACEPEVVDLANFLNKMGAQIEGAGTARITIDGVRELHGAEHEVIPDRIEAGTFLIAGAIAGNGKGVTVTRVDPAHLECLLRKLRESGFEVETPAKDAVTIRRGARVAALDLVTEPYPGFPTDMQAQMCALLATVEGISVVTETVFPQRFMHIAELKRMGARADIEGASAVIRGVDTLSGAPVMASDLRASAALVLAALKAQGETEIRRVYHIDRGYEHIDDKLIQLGAKITREKE